MTVARLLAETDSRELTEWRAMQRLDPWGEGRADLRAGMVCATTANVWRGKSPPLSPADFVPDLEARRKRKRQTPEDMLRIGRSMCGA